MYTSTGLTARAGQSASWERIVFNLFLKYPRIVENLAKKEEFSPITSVTKTFVAKWCGQASVNDMVFYRYKTQMN